MTILVKKVFISSKPTFVYLLCPPLCGPFSIQESAAGGLSYKVKNSRFGENGCFCLYTTGMIFFIQFFFRSILPGIASFPLQQFL